MGKDKEAKLHLKEKAKKEPLKKKLIRMKNS